MSDHWQSNYFLKPGIEDDMAGDAGNSQPAYKTHNFFVEDGLDLVSVPFQFTYMKNEIVSLMVCRHPFFRSLTVFNLAHKITI